MAWLTGAPTASADEPTVEVAVDEARPESVHPEAAPAPKREPTGYFAVYAGASTDDPFIAGATIAQPDLFRTGMQLSLDAQLSARRQRFGLRFADPTLLGSQVTLTADLYNDRRVLPGFTREGSGGALTLSQPLGRHLRAFVGYRLEHVGMSYDEPVAARGGLFLPPQADGVISAVRGGLVYSTVDDASMPTSGTVVGTSVEVADRAFGSDLQFTKLDGWAHHHRALGPLTLHVGGTIAAIQGPGGVAQSERLFLDGSRDIRGYAPGSLGPIDALGRPIGGTLKITGRVELEAPLVRRIGMSVVGFYDAGGIFDGVRGGVGQSAGFGLLWRSPIGPLRFDWAFPLDGSGPRFVFGLGTFF